MSTMNSIGSVIKFQRKAKKLKQKQLSELVGISINALSLIELGGTKPHESTLTKICEALEIPKNAVLIAALDENEVDLQKREIFNTSKEFLLKLILKY